MNSRYDNLRHGSRGRLQHMRNYANKWNTDSDKMRRGVPRIDWREARKHGKGSISIDAHGPRFSDRFANIPSSVLDGLRDMGYVDEIRPADYGRALVDHRGWFADAFQDETYRGKVWRLPHGLFLAGYSESEGSGYSVLCARGNNLETFDSLRDAIYAADHLAERMAEEAREYSERWQEARQCDDDARDAIEDAKQARLLFHSLRLAYEARVGFEEEELIILAQMQEAKEMHAEKIGHVCELRAHIAELGMQGEF